MNARTVHALLVRFRKERDPRALAALFDETASELLEVACRLVSDDALAEDVLQNSFVAVIESIGRFDPNRGIESGPGWLVGILGNQAKEALRRARRTPDPRKLETNEPPEPIEFVARDEAGRAIRDAVETLPSRYRAVVSLALSGVTSPSAIAERLGRSAGAVRVQLHRAVGMLRAALPAGVGVGAALLLLSREAIAPMRVAVVRKAAASQVAVGTVSIAGKVCAVLVVGGVVVGARLGWLSYAERSGRVEVETPIVAEEVVPRTEESIEIAEDRGSSEVANAATTQGSARPRKWRRVDGSRRDLADFVIREPAGIDFANLRLVEPEHGDVVIDPSVHVRPGLAKDIAVIRDDRLPEELRTVSRAAALECLVGVDPARLEFGAGASPELAALIVVRKDSQIFALSAVDLRDADGEYENRIRFRPVPIIAKTGTPDARSDPEQDDSVSALTFDFSRARPDRIGDEIRERERGLVAELERWAAFYRGAMNVDASMTVSGCAFLEHAASISSNRGFHIAASSWSITSAGPASGTIGLGHDVSFTARPAPAITTTNWNQAGFVFDLGERPFTEFEPARLRAIERRSGSAPLAAGHTYFVLRNPHQDRLALVVILAIHEERFVVFAHRGVTSEQRDRLVKDWGSEFFEEFDGNARIRIDARSGTQRIARVRLNGDSSGGVVMSNNEFEDPPASVSSKSPLAWIRGGLIPEGSVWRLRRVEYVVLPPSDIVGRERVRVRVGDATLVDLDSRELPSSGAWIGDLTIRPGSEADAFVEIRRGAFADIQFEGTIEEAP